MEQTKPKGLPSNAYTPLKDGEKYLPFVPASQTIQEIPNAQSFGALSWRSFSRLARPIWDLKSDRFLKQPSR